MSKYKTISQILNMKNAINTNILVLKLYIKRALLFKITPKNEVIMKITNDIINKIEIRFILNRNLLKLIEK